ncbi:hypothetical protein FB567DRAFT_544386 [Paraphoma chrysanthemicola]|uniref:Uncharacterized protein n=1 Tax=Paraphoma chrysanthemicola TaxID=798071 RepID=A0A8K0REP4_9PLEO|nr:hypothetical protein FB567DRAFT_544386 [Paraphoma chrysanthemicola]
MSDAGRHSSMLKQAQNRRFQAPVPMQVANCRHARTCDRYLDDKAGGSVDKGGFTRLAYSRSHGEGRHARFGPIASTPLTFVTHRPTFFPASQAKMRVPEGHTNSKLSFLQAHPSAGRRNLRRKTQRRAAQSRRRSDVAAIGSTSISEHDLSYLSAENSSSTVSLVLRTRACLSTTHLALDKNSYTDWARRSLQASARAAPAQEKTRKSCKDHCIIRDHSRTCIIPECLGIPSRSSSQVIECTEDDPRGCQTTLRQLSVPSPALPDR